MATPVDAWSVFTVGVTSWRRPERAGRRHSLMCFSVGQHNCTDVPEHGPKNLENSAATTEAQVVHPRERRRHICQLN